MQYKAFALILLLGLVALVQGVAIAEPGYKKPHNYDQDHCKKQCHDALKPVNDECDSKYGGKKHYTRGDGSSGMDLSQSVNIIEIINEISFTEFDDGCHKCFLLVVIDCVFDYTQTAWSTTFFSSCIDITITNCY
jgi:hypothetical protein